MSEYQYYEFRTIDRPLDERARDALRDLSSRAELTASSFTATYTWGALPAEPSELLDRWFDAFVHVTDWGTRWPGFRFPRGALPEDDLEASSGGIFELIQTDEHTCLHFHLLPEEVGGEWTDGEGWLDTLLPLRDAIGAGDLRCLYLAWLVDVEGGGFEEEDAEPPVPPGLGALDGAHRDFGEFMQLDADLLAAAAEGSAPLAPAAPTREATLAWLAAQAAGDKDAWLLQVLDGDGASLRWALQERLQSELGRRPMAARSRTVGELLERAEALQTERLAREARRRAERERLEVARNAAERQAHLDARVGREDELWREVDALIAARQSRSYDRAAVLLADLRDLATHTGTRAAWSERLATLRQTHARKTSLIQRLDEVDE